MGVEADSHTQPKFNISFLTIESSDPAALPDNAEKIQGDAS